MRRKNYWLKVFSGVLFLKILFLLPIFTQLKLYWPQLSFTTWWKNFDAPYYLAVAQSNYNPTQILHWWSWLNRPPAYYPAHLPLFPFAIKLVNFLGISLPLSGFIISFILSFGVVWAWIKLYQKENKTYPSLLISWSVLLFPPRMWTINNIISPEPLFIILILLTFLFWQERKYLVALLLAGAAFWTKSPAFFLFASFGLWLWLIEHKGNLLKTFMDKRSWLIIFIGLLSFLTLSYFYLHQSGDFWAYFHSGNNIHLFWPPLQVFNPLQVWVGSFWLEDIVLLLGLYFYLLIRSWPNFKNSPLWIFSALYLSSLFFVAHRDISRYALPFVPLLLLMNKGILKDNWKNRLVFGLYLILTFFYSWNFINGNHL